MSRVETIVPDFVEYMPPALAAGVLYISIEHRVTKHLCACGCGEVVVLPLHPGQWALTFDGETITMSPSVGNVGQSCRSHYFIRAGRIVWSHGLSERDGSVGRERDRAAIKTVESERAQTPTRPRLIRRLIRRLTGR